MDCEETVASYAERIHKMADVLKLLGDRTRLTVLSLLHEGERCVCELVDALETTQPNISQHLRKLKAAGLVREERRGQWVYYRLVVQDRSYVAQLLKELPASPAARKHGNCC